MSDRVWVRHCKAHAAPSRPKRAIRNERVKPCAVWLQCHGTDDRITQHDVGLVVPLGQSQCEGKGMGGPDSRRNAKRGRRDTRRLRRKGGGRNAASTATRAHPRRHPACRLRFGMLIMCGTALVGNVTAADIWDCTGKCPGGSGTCGNDPSYGTRLQIYGRV
jgi:hypothetical protein